MTDTLFICLAEDDNCGETSSPCWHAIEALAEGHSSGVLEGDPWDDLGNDGEPWLEDGCHEDRDLRGEGVNA